MPLIPVLTRRRRWRRSGLACVLAAVALLATAGPASAHAELVSSDPADGAVVASEPARVTLRFSEEIVLKLSAVSVLGPDGRHLAVGPPTAGPTGEDSLAVDLPPDPHRGTFVVQWQVTAADDGHASSGDVMFAVGAPSAGAGAVSVAGLGHDRLTSGVFDAAEWLGFAGLSVVGGFALVGGFSAARPRPRQVVDVPDGVEEDDADEAGSAWPAVLGWAVLLVGTLLQLVTYAPASQGLALTHVLDRSLLSATLATREGHALMARLAVLAVAAVVGEAVLRRGGALVPVLFTLAVAATWSTTGHASTGMQAPLSIVSVTVHVAAMALWVGGLFTVAYLLVGRRARADGSSLGEVVGRFSRLALVAVVLIVVTGLYQAWREVGHLGALTGTTYGRLLLAKVAVLLVVVGVARYSRGLAHRWRSGDETALRSSVLVELAGAAVLLLLAVLLAGNAPAREAGNASRATTAVGQDRG